MSEARNAPDVLLEARHVGRKTAAGEWLLEDVCFCVRPGERWGITGPTGSGKTLLLRGLCLLDEIDAGEILHEGRRIENAEIPAFRREVVYLHQRPVLAEGTVEENLRLPFTLRIAGGAEFSRDEALRLLSSLGREGTFLEKSAGDLSGGEAQITALLRVLPLKPRVLLLDEPTAALDAGSAAAIETLVAGWLEEDRSRATVWVSHDAAQTGRVAAKTMRLERGRVREGPDAD